MSRWGGGHVPERLDHSGPTDAQLLVFNATTGLWAPKSASGDVTMDNTGKFTLSGAGMFAASTGSVNNSVVTVGSFTTLGTAATLTSPAAARTYIAIAAVEAYPLALNKDSDWQHHVDISVDGGTTFAGSISDIKAHYNSNNVGPTGVATGVVMGIRRNVTPTGTISTRYQVNQGAGASGDAIYVGQILLLQLPPG